MIVWQGTGACRFGYADRSVELHGERCAGADHSVEPPPAQLLSTSGEANHDRTGPSFDPRQQVGDAVT
jgi:hypothetical protein